MKSGVLAIALIFSSLGWTQGYYYAGGSQDQYFTASYGLGYNTWSANSFNHKLWDPNGRQIVDGDSHLNANTVSELFNIGVLTSVNQFRLGFGLNFELFTLLEVDIQDENGTTTHGFPEIFSVNKVYAQYERRLLLNNSETLEFAVGAKGGIYFFSMVNSTSLFGEARLGTTPLAQIYAMGSVKVSDRIAIMTQLICDYKYFDNTMRESPTDLRYHILTYAGTAGIRLLIN